jgi:hypothetical protein
MRRVSLLCGKKTLFVLIMLLILIAAGWWQRTPLLAWYYVRGLAAAEDEARAAWIERVAGLDAGAVPRLLACLESADSRACANALEALAHLARSWGSGDPRTLQVLQQVAERFPSHALALAEAFIDTVPPGQGGETIPSLVRAGLKTPDPDCRVRAVRLMLHAALRSDAELLAQAVPLLRDPAAPVRRAALLALGMAESVVSEDSLLPLLHDPDADVRRLCEAALRGRGLQEDHLRLARLISDARPSARLEVFEVLNRANDLDAGTWLRHLSLDPSPAVRAAAARAAAAQTQVDLRAQLRQLAQEDPSPTVRQLAAHYWQQHVKGLAATRP